MHLQYLQPNQELLADPMAAAWTRVSCLGISHCGGTRLASYGTTLCKSWQLKALVRLKADLQVFSSNRYLYTTCGML